MLLVSITFSKLLFAQHDRFRFEGMDVGNGLSSNQINSIIKDEKGFIRFGTVSGLNRYDILDKDTGLFKHFEHVENDKTSLSHNIVIDILQDNRGLIWVATRDGLNLFDSEKTKFKTYRTEDGLHNVSCNPGRPASLMKDAWY